MRAVVIYESLTGNTAKAAGHIAAGLRAEGVSSVVCPVAAIDYQALAEADLVIVGSWTDGLFFFGQRPAKAARLGQMPFITGKTAAVFCTYALDTGPTLDKLSAIVADRGGDVIGGMAIKRNRLEEGSREFVERILGVVSAAS
jgi:flavodoxin